MLPLIKSMCKYASLVLWPKVDTIYIDEYYLVIKEVTYYATGSVFIHGDSKPSVTTITITKRSILKRKLSEFKDFLRKYKARRKAIRTINKGNN